MPPSLQYFRAVTRTTPILSEDFKVILIDIPSAARAFKRLEYVSPAHISSNNWNIWAVPSPLTVQVHIACSVRNGSEVLDETIDVSAYGKVWYTSCFNYVSIQKIECDISVPAGCDYSISVVLPTDFDLADASKCTLILQPK